MTTAKTHLAHVTSAINNEPHDDATHAALEALEYLLTIRADAEEHAEKFINRSKAKSIDAKTFGDALHQDFVEMISNAKQTDEDLERFFSEASVLFIRAGGFKPERKRPSLGGTIMRLRLLVERIEAVRSIREMAVDYVMKKYPDDEVLKRLLTDLGSMTWKNEQ